MTRPCNLVNMRVWINALESGEFLQGHGSLRGANTHCCLGVATELAVRAGVEAFEESEWFCDLEREEGGHQHTLWCLRNDEEDLCREVVSWLGLDTEVERYLHTNFSNPSLHIPEFDEDSNNTDAIALNDDFGATFVEIAWRLRRLYLEE
jgi:hypothetical protein